VPACPLGQDGARPIRLRHDPAPDLVAPPSATFRTDLDIHPASRLRSVNYMLNHMRTESYVTARILPVSSYSTRWGQSTAYFAGTRNAIKLTARPEAARAAIWRPAVLLRYGWKTLAARRGAGP
jgi:hypothetical protein